MLKVPNELDLLSFFESEPIESEPGNGYFCYKVSINDSNLFFSYNILESSVQVRLQFEGANKIVISEEMAEEIKIVKGVNTEKLSVTFKIGNLAQSNLEISIKPQIDISWSTLEL